uniref:Tryptophan synthase alpha chain n=1 Tax=Apophlaea sinclairii TaxID=212746 RepID=A0A1C9CBI8_9FLOR|nr:tryptophan synthase alpha subunit [Apophlaea sinclairii]AOM65751.1 tryptophan synthase alpha subunit [Apophlaea sinclairii]
MFTISQVLQHSSAKFSLIPFITAGDPDLYTTAEVIQTLDYARVDIIELGLPYSVPLADGPVIQAASSRALSKKTHFKTVLNLIKSVNCNLNTPLVLFTYYNPLLSYGTFKFIQYISYTGIQGILIPDLPLEESEYVLHLCYYFNIELIFLVAPTSTLERTKKIVNKTSGCIYLVSKTGVTGTYSILQRRVQDLINYITYITKKPLIVGFGISTVEQVVRLCKLKIQGVVLGSIFVSKLANKKSKDNVKKVFSFCQDIKQKIKEYKKSTPRGI